MKPAISILTLLPSCLPGLGPFSKAEDRDLIWRHGNGKVSRRNLVL